MSDDEAIAAIEIELERLELTAGSSFGVGEYGLPVRFRRGVVILEDPYITIWGRVRKVLRFLRACAEACDVSYLPLPEGVFREIREENGGF